MISGASAVLPSATYAETLFDVSATIAPAGASSWITGTASIHWGPNSTRSNGSATTAIPMLTGTTTITITAMTSMNVGRNFAPSSMNLAKPGNNARLTGAINSVAGR